jgi:nucleoside-diphosphate-sugar epimerase
MLQGKRFLITGATGRLGCALVKRLEDLSADVAGVVLPGYPERPKRTEWQGKNLPHLLNSAEDLSQLKSADYIIHLHWLVDRTRSFADQLAFEVEKNITGLRFFWEWLSHEKPRCLINVSSIRVFGPTNDGLILSGTEPRPSSPYGIAKVTAENFIDAFLALRMKLSHLRLPSTTSVGENPSQLMTQLYLSASRGKEITVNVGHRTHLIYIDDMVDYLIQAAVIERAGRFNLVPPGIDNKTIAAKFEEVTGRRLNAKYLDMAPETKDPSFASDLEMLKSPWTRHTSLEEIIGHFYSDVRVDQ